MSCEAVKAEDLPETDRELRVAWGLLCESFKRTEYLVSAVLGMLEEDS